MSPNTHISLQKNMVYSIILKRAWMKWNYCLSLFIKPLGMDNDFCSIMVQVDDFKYHSLHQTKIFIFVWQIISDLFIANCYCFWLFGTCRFLKSRDEKCSDSTDISCPKVDQFVAHKNMLYLLWFLDSWLPHTHNLVIVAMWYWLNTSGMVISTDSVFINHN